MLELLRRLRRWPALTRLLPLPALALALAPALTGCASSAPTEPRGRVGESALFVAPVLDRTGRLSPVELVRIQAELTKEIFERARIDEKRHRTPLRLANHAAEAGHRLAVTIERFDPEGTLALRLLVALGAGRPGWEARVSLRPLAGGRSLGDRSFERRSSAFLEPGGSDAMLADVASTAAAFVNRRR